MFSVANSIKIFGIRTNGYRFTRYSLCIKKYGRTGFASASSKKDMKLSMDATKNLLKKRVIVKWNITNRKLFGPIIGNSKIIKDGDNKCYAYSIENVSSNKDNIDGSSKLLPVGLWGCQELFEKQIKRKQSPASTRAVQTSSISTGEETLENEEELTSKLPDQPFFKKDKLILPFPMLVGKRGAQTEAASEEISSLTSPEENLPSVTQILKDTVSEESEMVLELWRKRKISEVGEEGLKEYMRDAFSVGKQLHTSIETRLRGVDYSAVHVEPRISGHWLSLKTVLTNVEDVKVLESCVVHPQLKYKGFVDCVARYKGNLVAIEWKTSQRIKNTLKQAYDDPVQMAAYIGALNADSNYGFEVENALLVVAYPTGRPADVMMLDRKKCEKYWFDWLKRLEKFNLLKGR